MLLSHIVFQPQHSRKPSREFWLRQEISLIENTVLNNKNIPDEDKEIQAKIRDQYLAELETLQKDSK